MSDEIECRDRLGQGLPGRDRTIRRWSRYCREVVDIGLPPGATESNGPPPRTAESEPLAHAVPLSATSAGMPPLAECLLGGASAPSANSLTSNSVWTCRRAMTGQKRDGGRRRTRALYTEAYKRERRRQGRGWVVLMAGVVIGATHVVIHLGQLRVTSERRMAGSRGRLSDGDGPRARRSHDDRFPHPKAEGRVLRTRSRDL